MTYWELATSWNYFLSIERDLYETSRYIEPEDQEKTYSFEFYKIIMLSCAEIETAFKQMCKFIEPNRKCGCIADYKDVILSKFPQICTCEVVVQRWHGRAIQPFGGWDTGPLSWWGSYQDIKHSRFLKIKQANYEVAVYSLAALYVLILYLYRMNDHMCKADDSKCFWSKYHPAAHYLPPMSELPDFVNQGEKKDEVNEYI